jgi:CSLREA domain-containing protein
MYVTATATDDKNNTSEFSPRLRVGNVLTNVIVVNSINDVDDGVANTNHTSLREAIMAANNHSGPDLIRFAIGSGARTIGLTNLLPALLDAETTIDATTQPGFAGQPLIYLDGSLLVPSGLRLYSPSNTVRGFAINRFGFGIAGEGALASPFGGFNVIEGNYLGTDPTGGSPGSQDFGLYLNSGCPGNRIGGPTLAARNIMSGNKRAGAFIFDSAANTFAGNFIGTDRTGSNSLGNGFAALNPLGGLFIQRARGTVIGGSAPGMGNLIAGNSSLFQNQLFLWDDSSGSVVQGNFIGTDVTGRTNLGNSLTAIDVTGTGGVLIKSNLLCGSGFTATLYLASSSNRVEGNLIGTDVTGTRAIPNGTRGIFIDAGGSANLIGGTTTNSRNLLSAAQYGIRINGPSNVVQGNIIGTKIDGISPLGNTGDGVTVQQSFNLIGGVDPGAGNIIAFNGGSGVLVSAGTNNAILGNSIFSNTNLAVDLGTLGVTPNDFADVDSGPNNLQNFPLLSAARNIGASTILEGTLNSRSNTSYRIEFFSNTNCHSSGNGDGRTFLNATTTTTDGSGNATFSFTHPIPVTAGLKITATATDPNNNTSEFSPCATVINDTNHVVLSFSTSLPYTLSWPTSAANFLLERSTNLTPPAAWEAITSGIVVIGSVNVFAITNHPNSPTIFFRLRRP